MSPSIEQSAGAVVVDPSGRAVLMVRSIGSHRAWGFPKGHIEEDETAERCAIREVEEETGLSGRALTLIADLGTVTQHIWFPRSGERVRRATTFYLYRASTRTLASRSRDPAHDRARWVAWSELESLPERYTYVRRLAGAARATLKRLPRP